MRLTCLFFIFCSISCRSMLGVTNIREYNNDDAKVFLQQNKINDSIIYLLDKDYKKYLLTLSTDSASIKNHLQPLQASYYNKEGALVSFHVNCYAPGFPDLNWNYKEAMESFPPKTQAPLDTLLTLQRHLRSLKSNDPNNFIEEDKFDYYIVVGWAGFMKKQSRNLINAVKDNLKLNTQNKRVKIIYVCTDNVYLE